MRGADDAVLLRLDGPDDVVHPSGAGGIERCEQHLVGAGALVAGALGVGQVEQFVVERGDGTALGGDVPAAAQPHRGIAGGEIEGAGDFGAPVDDDRGAFPVVPADSDASDVMGRAVPEIELSEAQPVLAGVEGAEQPGLFGDQHITLEARLETRPGLRQCRPRGGLGLVAQLIEAGVETGDELLFLPEFLG